MFLLVIVKLSFVTGTMSYVTEYVLSVKRALVHKTLQIKIIAPERCFFVCFNVDEIRFVICFVKKLRAITNLINSHSNRI